MLRGIFFCFVIILTSLKCNHAYTVSHQDLIFDAFETILFNLINVVIISGILCNVIFISFCDVLYDN